MVGGFGMSDDSPTTILKAAVKEFAEAGFKGARMEAIAKRAGLNKALVYRHFFTREDLYAAALSFKFRRRFQVAAAMPASLAEAMVYWFRHAADDPDFLALLHREALNLPDETLAEEKLRKQYYKEQVADLEARSQRGQIDPKLDRPALLLALVALISFPAFFPNMARLITGKDVTSKAFRTQWEALLSNLAQRLA